MEDRISRLHAFLEDDPNDPFVLFALAKEYGSAGQKTRMKSIFRKLVEMQYPGVFYHYGQVLEGEGDKAGAADLYKQGIEVAGKEGDQHSIAELRRALMDLEMDDLI